MSVTFLDPTLPNRIPSPFEVIDATVSSELDQLTVSLRLPNGEWEVIWQDFLFGLKYNQSQLDVDSGTFHITRMAGWPRNQPLQFRFKEGQDGPSTTGKFDGISFAGGELAATTGLAIGAINTPPLSWTVLAEFLVAGASAGEHDFFGNRNPSTGGGAFLGVYLTLDGAGGLRMQATGSGGDDASDAWAVLADGKLHLVTGTLDAAGHLKLFVDGVDVGGAHTTTHSWLGAASRVGYGLSQSYGNHFPNVVFAGGALSTYAVTLSQHQEWAAEIRARGTFCARAADPNTWVWLAPQGAALGAPGYHNASESSTAGLTNGASGTTVLHSYDVGDLNF